MLLLLSGTAHATPGQDARTFPADTQLFFSGRINQNSTVRDTLLQCLATYPGYHAWLEPGGEEMSLLAQLAPTLEGTGMAAITRTSSRSAWADAQKIVDQVDSYERACSSLTQLGEQVKEYRRLYHHLPASLAALRKANLGRVDLVGLRVTLHPDGSLSSAYTTANSYASPPGFKAQLIPGRPTRRPPLSGIFLAARCSKPAQARRLLNSASSDIGRDRLRRAGSDAWLLPSRYPLDTPLPWRDTHRFRLTPVDGVTWLTFTDLADPAAPLRAPRGQGLSLNPLLQTRAESLLYFAMASASQPGRPWTATLDPNERVQSLLATQTSANGARDLAHSGTCQVELRIAGLQPPKSPTWEFLGGAPARAGAVYAIQLSAARQLEALLSPAVRPSNHDWKEAPATVRRLFGLSWNQLAAGPGWATLIAEEPAAITCSPFAAMPYGKDADLPEWLHQAGGSVAWQLGLPESMSMSVADAFWKRLGHAQAAEAVGPARRYTVHDGGDELLAWPGHLLQCTGPSASRKLLQAQLDTLCGRAPALSTRPDVQAFLASLRGTPIAFGYQASSSFSGITDLARALDLPLSPGADFDRPNRFVELSLLLGVTADPGVLRITTRFAPQPVPEARATVGRVPAWLDNLRTLVAAESRPELLQAEDRMLTPAEYLAALAAQNLRKQLQAATPQGKVSGCLRQLDKLHHALDAYRDAHQDFFPDRLDQLVPSYLETLPTCPAAGSDTYSASYQVSHAPERFTLSCFGANHTPAGLGPNLPVCTSAQGTSRAENFP